MHSYSRHKNVTYSRTFVQYMTFASAKYVQIQPHKYSTFVHVIERSTARVKKNDGARVLWLFRMTSRKEL